MIIKYPFGNMLTNYGWQRDDSRSMWRHFFTNHNLPHEQVVSQVVTPKLSNIFLSEIMWHIFILPHNSLVNSFFFFFECFKLQRPYLMIALYHQTKTPISFWCRRGLNPKSLIQPSETLLIDNSLVNFDTIYIILYGTSVIYFRKIFTNSLKVLVNNLFKERFYRKRKKNEYFNSCFHFP